MPRTAHTVKAQRYCTFKRWKSRKALGTTQIACLRRMGTRITASPTVTSGVLQYLTPATASPQWQTGATIEPPPWLDRTTTTTTTAAIGAPRPSSSSAAWGFLWVIVSYLTERIYYLAINCDTPVSLPLFSQNNFSISYFAGRLTSNWIAEGLVKVAVSVSRPPNCCAWAKPFHLLLFLLICGSLIRLCPQVGSLKWVESKSDSKSQFFTQVNMILTWIKK